MSDDDMAKLLEIVTAKLKWSLNKAGWLRSPKQGRGHPYRTWDSSRGTSAGQLRCFSMVVGRCVSPLPKFLCSNPDALLMDETTNHLDLESIKWLEEWLIAFKVAVLMTSHDRTFMSRIVSKIVEVANKTITSYTGNYDYYLRERDIRRQQLIASHRKQQEMLAKRRRVHSSICCSGHPMLHRVQSRVKKLDKIESLLKFHLKSRSWTFNFLKPSVVVMKWQNLRV